jgi:N-methylhydantoinase A
VGSAIGFLRAPIAFEVVRSRYMRLSDFDPAAANTILEEMRREARDVVLAGAGGAALVEIPSAFMRYVGQGHEIVVSLPDRPLLPQDGPLLRDAFQRDYIALFSRAIPHAEVEVLTWSMAVSTKGEAANGAAASQAKAFAAEPTGKRRLLDPDSGAETEMPVYWRPDLRPGARLDGPAVIAEDETTTFVTASFDAFVNAQGCIVLERRGPRQQESRT